MRKDLTNALQELFLRFGFKKIPNTEKAYYKGLNTGKIYRVYQGNKLKPLKDGATATRYGHVKLKIKNGKFRTFATHRLIIAGEKPNPKNKPQVNHLTGLKNHNRIDELDWATGAENCRHYQILKREKELMNHN